MPVKPADLLLDVVEFLGVLVPGAILVFLHLPRLGPEGHPASATECAIVLAAGFIAGELLLALTEPLNDWALPAAKYIYPGLRSDTLRMEQAAAPSLRAATVRAAGATCFHAALSRLRLEAPAAAGEVDRHMAQYKLLRNLVGVCCVDLAISLAFGPRSAERLLVDAAVALLSFAAFTRMFAWAHLLAFQYCRLLKPPADA